MLQTNLAYMLKGKYPFVRPRKSWNSFGNTP